VLGPTGNSGLHPKRGGQHPNRRPAIHFAVFYSSSEQFAEWSRRDLAITIPIDFQWMDPLALYRENPPLDTHSMKLLPQEEKQIPIPIIFEDGEIAPLNTKVVWPYMCKRD
jgi:hypothetical protein